MAWVSEKRPLKATVHRQDDACHEPDSKYAEHFPQGSRRQRQGSRKPQQFEILKEILPAGERIYEPWLGIPSEFFSARF